MQISRKIHIRDYWVGFYFQKQQPEVFLKTSQNAHENTCARVSFLIKLQAWCLQLY